MKLLAIIAFGSTLLMSAVDINNATSEELATLKGIGAKKAQSIVEYRAKNCFKSIEDLAEVKGISHKTIAKNKENLEIGACKR